MNKHGQTLVLFVILIPIIILLFAIIVDTGVVINKKIEYKSITKSAIESALKHDFDTQILKEVLIENNIDTDHLELNTYDGKIEVQNNFMVSSVFGSIIGIKNYHIKIDIMGYLENGKVRFE